MKHFIYLTLAASLVSSAYPQTSTAIELRALSEQYKKDVDTVTEKYHAALEQLLQRATEANDQETVAKIKETLGPDPLQLDSKQSDSEQPDLKQFVGTWQVTNEQGYKNTWIFDKDGTYTDPTGRKGTWIVSEGKLSQINNEGQRTDFTLPIKKRVLNGIRFDGIKVKLEKIK